MSVEQVSETRLSDAELESELTTWAGRVAAGEARLLALIAEFDRREAWAVPGLLSCAHWLSWRLGLGLTAAYERVRVARALRELPVTAAAMGGGQLSWTQVRAITRAATAQDEQTWVELARCSTGAQIERLARGVRRARRLDDDAADPEAAAYRVRCRVRYDEDGTMSISVRLPAEQGAVVLAALEQARAELDRQHSGSARDGSSSTPADPTEPTDSSAEEAWGQGELPASTSSEPRGATEAQGLLHLARSFLDTAATRGALAPTARSGLRVEVDPLSGWGRTRDGEVLPPGSVRGLSGLAAAGHDRGRDARQPSRALRELLGTLDGERCRYPGCTRRRRLHAHHVREWSAGGRTDLANLVLLCGRHHTLVHRDETALQLHPDRTLTVATTEGTPVPHHPPLPWQPAADVDPKRAVAAGTLPPRWVGDPLDLRYAVSVLVAQAA